MVVRGDADPSDAGGLEPAQQRRQVHEPGRSGVGARPARRRGCDRPRQRQRRRHPGGDVDTCSICSPRSRARASTRTAGLGIGLTLVKRMVEMHGGSVSARSDGRARQRVRRPPPRAGRRKRRAAESERHLHHRGAVDGAAPNPGRRRQRRCGREPAAGARGPAARCRRRPRRRRGARGGATHEPDVVLLDIDLPLLDGLEVARRLQSRWSMGAGRRALLVATTGLGRDLDRARTKQAGFDHHLVKPIDLASLESLLTAPRE